MTFCGSARAARRMRAVLFYGMFDALLTRLPTLRITGAGGGCAAILSMAICSCRRRVIEAIRSGLLVCSALRWQYGSTVI